LDNLNRTIELERQKYDLAILKDRTAKAFGQGQVNIRYTSSTGESFYITNDQQLQKAIKDAEKSGAKNIEVKAFRDTTGGAASAPAAARPATTAAPASNAPAQARPAAAPAAAPAKSAGAPGALNTYKLPADRNSSNDRVTVEHQQGPDHFIFFTKPSKYDTDVEVVLNGTALQFLTTHTFTEGNAQKVCKGTQGVSLPFAPSPDQVQVVGQQIKISFPH